VPGKRHPRGRADGTTFRCAPRPPTGAGSPPSRPPTTTWPWSTTARPCSRRPGAGDRFHHPRGTRRSPVGLPLRRGKGPNRHRGRPGLARRRVRVRRQPPTPARARPAPVSNQLRHTLAHNKGEPTVMTDGPDQLRTAPPRASRRAIRLGEPDQASPALSARPNRRRKPFLYRRRAGATSNV